MVRILYFKILECEVVFDTILKTPEMKGNGVQWTIVATGDDHFLSGGRKRVYQWSASGGDLKWVWAMPDAGYIQKIVVSPDGTKMAATSGSAMQDVYIFELP